MHWRGSLFAAAPARAGWAVSFAAASPKSLGEPAGRLLVDGCLRPGRRAPPAQQAAGRLDRRAMIDIGAEQGSFAVEMLHGGSSVSMPSIHIRTTSAH